MTRADHRLTIGLPVYNGEATLAAALESLLAQTHADFELIVSDNASTDATEDIARSYARSDDRIRYVRQPVNLGATPNFGYVLRHARSPHFMWAAGDDEWLPGFVAANLRVLELRPDYVCSVSRVAFVDRDGRVVDAVGPPESRHPLRPGTFPLDASPADNVIAFLESPDCNSRFYGVHRTDVLRRCYSEDERYLASDWVVMARTLAFGKHAEVPEVLMRRGAEGESTDVVRLVEAINPSWLSRRWLPMWPMTRRILFGGDVPVAWGDPRRLARLLGILREKNLAEFHHHRNERKARRRIRSG